MPRRVLSPGLFVKHLWVSALNLVDFKPIVPGHFLKKQHKQRESKATTMSSMSVSSRGEKRGVTDDENAALSKRELEAVLVISLNKGWVSETQL